MNTSNVAAEIIKDIYNFSSEHEKLKNDYNSKIITKEEFNKKQFMISYKLAYLNDVIDILKEKGYKFARYEKEMCIIQDLSEDIVDTMDVDEDDDIIEVFNMENLPFKDKVAITTYLTKYEKVYDVIDEFYEDLKESVN